MSGECIHDYLSSVSLLPFSQSFSNLQVTRKCMISNFDKIGTRNTEMYDIEF